MQNAGIHGQPAVNSLVAIRESMGDSAIPSWFEQMFQESDPYSLISCQATVLGMILRLSKPHPSIFGIAAVDWELKIASWLKALPPKAVEEIRERFRLRCGMAGDEYRNFQDYVLNHREDDVSGCTRKALEILHARDDIESIAVLLKHTDDQGWVDWAVELVDRYSFIYGDTFSLVSYADDPRLNDIRVCEPESWWTIIWKPD